jgi:Fe-S-cluster-containing dehydrogenase component
MKAAACAPAFVHDLETCVGCHACAVACANENQLAPGTSWRHIVTFNEPRRPGLPTFHLSIACNHCARAPCMTYCPALAISRDARTGAVLIDEDACIGCRYCSWVCPYEAPRFDRDAGVMRKCTLCAPRLAEGLSPACVSLCPVGALKLGDPVDEHPRGVPGFPTTRIGPSITLLPLRTRHSSPGATAPATGADTPAPPPPPATPGITARSEWTLVVFTVAAQLLVGIGLARTTTPVEMPPAAFLGAGLLASIVSLAHLGRPSRAWRAGLNLRRSWLSREVVCFSGFLALSAASMLRPGAHPGWDWAAAGAGLLCLFSIDQVYAVMARSRRPPMDRVSGVSGGLLWGSLVGGHAWPAAALSLWRVAAYLQRHRSAEGPPRDLAAPPAIARVALGLAGLALWASGSAWSVPAGLGLIVAAEAIDRVGFYDALDVITPRRQMARDFAASWLAGRLHADHQRTP